MMETLGCGCDWVARGLSGLMTDSYECVCLACLQSPLDHERSDLLHVLSPVGSTVCRDWWRQ